LIFHFQERNIMDQLPIKQKQDDSTTVIEGVRNLLASSSKSTAEKADAIREEAVQTLDKFLKKTDDVQTKAYQFSTASMRSANQYVKSNMAYDWCRRGC